MRHLAYHSKDLKVKDGFGTARVAGVVVYCFHDKILPRERLRSNDARENRPIEVGESVRRQGAAMKDLPIPSQGLQMAVDKSSSFSPKNLLRSQTSLCYKLV
jgi:hypothetical protein